MSDFKTKIWVDADACPKIIKEVIFKFSSRLQIPVCLVANSYMKVPHTDLVSLVKVDLGADVADKYIATHCKEQDIVVTADLPLAGEVVKTGALAINPRGELYDEETICDRLSMRDFMTDLRDNGLVTGGPNTFSGKDKINFTNTLNKTLTKKGF